MPSPKTVSVVLFVAALGGSTAHAQPDGTQAAAPLPYPARTSAASEERTEVAPSPIGPAPAVPAAPSPAPPREGARLDGAAAVAPLASAPLATAATRDMRPDPEGTVLTPSAITGPAGSWAVSVYPLLTTLVAYSPTGRLRMRGFIARDFDRNHFSYSLSATFGLYRSPHVKVALVGKLIGEFQLAEEDADKNVREADFARPVWGGGFATTVCATPACHLALTAGVLVQKNNRDSQEAPTLALQTDTWAFVNAAMKFSPRTQLLFEMTALRGRSPFGLFAVRIWGEARRGSFDVGLFSLQDEEVPIVPYLGWTLRSK